MRLSAFAMACLLNSNRAGGTMKVSLLWMLLIAATAGAFDNFYTYGNTTIGSNGQVIQRYGNITMDNFGNRATQYGNTVYTNDGTTYRTYGNTTYDNNGNRWSTYGNTTYGSNG